MAASKDRRRDDLFAVRRAWLEAVQLQRAFAHLVLRHLANAQGAVHRVARFAHVAGQANGIADLDPNLGVLLRLANAVIFDVWIQDHLELDPVVLYFNRAVVQVGAKATAINVLDDDCIAVVDRHPINWIALLVHR